MINGGSDFEVFQEGCMILYRLQEDMRQRSKSSDSFDSFDSIVLCTCACTLLQYKLFLLGLRIGRLYQLGTIMWLPSVFILDTLVFGIIFAFLCAPRRGLVKTRAAAIVSRTFATSILVLVVFSACASMVLMIETGMLLSIVS